MLVLLHMWVRLGLSHIESSQAAFIYSRLLCLCLVRCKILVCPSVDRAGCDAALVVLVAWRRVEISIPGLHMHCLCVSG